MKFIDKKIKEMVIETLNDPEVMEEALKFAEKFTKIYIQKQAERFKN